MIHSRYIGQDWIHKDNNASSEKKDAVFNKDTPNHLRKGMRKRSLLMVKHDLDLTFG